MATRHFISRVRGKWNALMVLSRTVNCRVSIHAVDATGIEGTDLVSFDISRGANDVVGALWVPFEISGDWEGVYPVGIPQTNGFWPVPFQDPSDVLAWDPAARIGYVSIANGRSSTRLSFTTKDDNRSNWDRKLTIRLLTPEELVERAEAIEIGTESSDARIAPNVGMGTLVYGAAFYRSAAFGGSFDYHSRYLGLLEVNPEAAEASATVWDNDGAAAEALRNINVVETGLTRDTLQSGGLQVSSYDGVVTAGLFGEVYSPKYTTSNADSLVTTIRLRLPWNEDPQITNLQAKLVIGGISGTWTTYDVSDLDAYLSVNPGRDIVLRVVGPEDLETRLTSGHYEFYVTIKATIDEESFEKTVLSSTEIVNRSDAALGAPEFGKDWWLPDLDRIVPYVGGSTVFERGEDDSESYLVRSTNGGASEDVLPSSGLALLRGDQTSAWFATSNRPFYLSGTIQQPPSLSGTWTGRATFDLLYGPFSVSDQGLWEEEASAEWAIEGLAAGAAYEILVAFRGGDDFATNVPYTIINGTDLVSGASKTTVLVDQRFGATWSNKIPDTQYADIADAVSVRSLGLFIPKTSTNGGSLTVRINTQLPEYYSQHAGEFVDGKIEAGYLYVRQIFAADKTASDGSFELLTRGSKRAGTHSSHDGVWQIWGNAQLPSGGTSSRPYFLDPSYNGQATDYLLIAKDGTRQEFTSSGLLRTRVDRNGNRTEYIYTDADDDGLVDELQQRTVQGGRTTVFQYEDGYLSGIVDDQGRHWHWDIEDGRVTSAGLAVQDSSRTNAGDYGFTYTSQGALESVRDPEGRATSVSYDVNGRVNEITQADGSKISVHAFLTDGLSSAVAGEGIPLRPAAGVWGSWESSEANDLREPWGSYTSAFDSGSSQSPPIWRFQADAFGLTTALVKPEAATGAVWRWKRQKDGLVTAEVLPPGGLGYQESPDPNEMPIRTRFEYDNFGNLIRKHHPDGRAEQWWYVGYGLNIVKTHRSRDGLYDEWTFPTSNNRGNPISMKEANGSRTTRYEYNPPPTSVSGAPGGLLTSKTVAYGTSDAATTGWQYYDFGALVGLLSEIDFADGTSESYAYNPQRQRIGVTDQRGQTTNFDYDELNRVVQILEPDPGTGQHGRHEAKLEYDKVGNLRFEIDVSLNRTTEKQYDAMNRTRFIIRPIPGGSPNSVQTGARASFRTV